MKDRIKFQMNYYQPAITRLFKDHVSAKLDIFNWRLATEYEDMTKGYDAVVTCDPVHLEIPIRVRSNFTCKYRDFTLRYHDSTAPGRHKCEYDKVREGAGKYYFYAWTGWLREHVLGKINEFIVVDLDKLRSSGLLDREHPIRYNDDHTMFKGLLIEDLEAAGCLLVHWKETNL